MKTWSTFLSGKRTTCSRPSSSKQGSASGTYKVENDTLTFAPIAGGNPALLGRRPSRRIELDPSGTRLSLKGNMTRGYGVEEVWEKLEDFD